jgi:hypothetical protein
MRSGEDDFDVGIDLFQHPPDCLWTIFACTWTAMNHRTRWGDYRLVHGRRTHSEREGVLLRKLFNQIKLHRVGSRLERWRRCNVRDI